MKARPLVVGAVILAVVVGAGLGGRALVRLRVEDKTARLVGNAQRCLLGPPLEPGETAAERVDRIRWAPRPPASRKAPVGMVEPSWPVRCRPDVEALEARADVPELAAAAARIDANLSAIENATAMKKADVALDTADLDLLARAHGSGAIASDTPLTLSPRPLLPRSELASIRARALGFASMHVRDRDEEPRDTIHLWGLSTKTCAVTSSANAALDHVACGPSETRVFRPSLERDGARYSFAPHDRTDATRKSAAGALVATDLLREHGAERAVVATFEETPDSAFFLGPAAVFRADDRWLALTTRPDAARLDPPHEIARGGTEAATCRAPRRDTLVLSSAPGWATSRVTNDGLGGYQVLFAENGGLSAPKAVPPEAGGAGRRDRQSLGPRTLACDDLGARIATSRITWDADLVDDAEAIRWTCTDAGCEKGRSHLGRLAPVMGFYGGNWTHDPDTMEAPLVVDLGERTLVVWRSNDAVWAKLAPFGELEQAPPRVLTGGDDKIYLDFAQDAVTTRDRIALVLLSARSDDGDSVIVVRADAGGDLRILPPP
jgi:hypothetical protein